MKLISILFLATTLLFIGCHAKKEAAKQTDDVAIDDVKINIPPPPPPTENTGREVFSVVEDMPEFPGGQTASDSFIYTNFTIPAEASEVGVRGKLFVQFIIDTTGTMTDIKIMKDGAGFGCAEETMRVFKLMAATYKWTPGEQRGKKVNVKYIYPVIINAYDYDSVTRKNTKYHTN